jgi:hypothetical protein
MCWENKPPGLMKDLLVSFLLSLKITGKIAGFASNHFSAIGLVAAELIDQEVLNEFLVVTGSGGQPGDGLFCCFPGNWLFAAAHYFPAGFPHSLPFRLFSIPDDLPGLAAGQHRGEYYLRI